MTAPQTPSPDQTPTTPAHASRVRGRAWLMLLLILAIGAALRVHDLGRRGLWYDEATSLMLADGWPMFASRLPAGVPMYDDDLPDVSRPLPQSSWRDVVAAVRGGDVHPPGFYVALRAWRLLTGATTDAQLRGLSVLCSVATIVLTFLLARAVLNRDATALWASLFMAIAPTQVQYAQQLRGYAMAQTLTVTLLLATALLARRGWTVRRGAALACCAAAAMFVHYFSVGIVAGAGVFLAWYLRGRARWLAVGSLTAGGLAFAVLWGPALAEQLAIPNMTTDLLDREPARHLWNVVLAVARSPIRLLADPYGPSVVAGMMSLATLVLLPLTPPIRRPLLLLPWLAFLGALGVPAAMDLSKGTLSLERVRYTLLAGPPTFILLAACGVGMVRHLLPGAVVAYCLYSMPLAYDKYFYHYGEATAAMRAHARAGEALICYVPPRSDRATAEVAYAAISRYVPRLSPVLITGTPPDEQTVRAMTGDRPFWVFSADDTDVPRDLPFVASDGPSSHEMAAGQAARYRLRDRPPTTAGAATPATTPTTTPANTLE